MVSLIDIVQVHVAQQIAKLQADKVLHKNGLRKLDDVESRIINALDNARGDTPELSHRRAGLTSALEVNRRSKSILIQKIASIKDDIGKLEKDATKMRRDVKKDRARKVVVDHFFKINFESPPMAP